MNIKLMIVSEDADYSGALSKCLSEEYAEEFEVSSCDPARLGDTLQSAKSYDIVLADQGIEKTALPPAKMYAVLWDETTAQAGPAQSLYIRKYQRISKHASELLEHYAKVAQTAKGPDGGHAKITAVWSPAGGVGKTTVAMAYAAGLAVQNRQVLYLDLESFSSVPAYFHDEGKSISRLLEALGGDTCMEVLLSGIKKKDSASGILYFGMPDNYDDINILTLADTEALLSACAAQCEELVVDLPSGLGERTRYLLESADKVLAVLDGSVTAAVKWGQFKTQNSVFEKIADRMLVVANKGAAVSETDVRRVVKLPAVKSGDPAVVYKTLSAHSF